LLVGIQHVLLRLDPLVSARPMARYLREYFPRSEVALYRDFEAYGSLPVYLRHPVPVIDSASNDLYYGARLAASHPSLIATADVLAGNQPVLVIVLDHRREEFRASALGQRAQPVARFGAAALYVVDPRIDPLTKPRRVVPEYGPG